MVKDRRSLVLIFLKSFLTKYQNSMSNGSNEKANTILTCTQTHTKANTQVKNNMPYNLQDHGFYVCSICIKIVL